MGREGKLCCYCLPLNLMRTGEGIFMDNYTTHKFEERGEKRVKQGEMRSRGDEDGIQSLRNFTE